MKDNEITIGDLKKQVDAFVDKRDWKQFHSPKNLAMALSVEVSELMELFQWLDLEQAKEVMKSGKVREDALDEIADIFIYLLAFCNTNKIDISDALMKKMKKNIKKYPADKFNGHF
jgi:NTP pyrophosphatase (non-canonical NTP hydrolase)